MRYPLPKDDVRISYFVFEIRHLRNNLESPNPKSSLPEIGTMGSRLVHDARKLGGTFGGNSEIEM